MLNKIMFLDHTWFSVWRNYFGLSLDTKVFELCGVVVMPETILLDVAKEIMYE